MHNHAVSSQIKQSFSIQIFYFFKFSSLWKTCISQGYFIALRLSDCLTCAVYPIYETIKTFPRIASSLTASQERLESVT